MARIQLDKETVSKEDDQAVFFGVNKEAAEANYPLFMPTISQDLRNATSKMIGDQMIIDIQSDHTSGVLLVRDYITGETGVPFAFGDRDAAIRMVRIMAEASTRKFDQWVKRFPYAQGFFQYNQEKAIPLQPVPAGVDQPPTGYVYATDRVFNELEGKYGRSQMVKCRLPACGIVNGQWIEVGHNPFQRGLAYKTPLIPNLLTINLSVPAATHPLSKLVHDGPRVLVPMA